jgi:hypothetical protein
LNCTLSYPRNGKARVYRVRVSTITTGFQMIAEESQARASRAFYPYQTAPSKFSIQVDLIGDAERRSFNRYMMNYAHYILNPSIKGNVTPQMRVTVPSRGFVRVGIPNQGIEFGDRMGVITWRPMVVFEVSQEPFDWNDKVTHSFVRAKTARLNEPESQYFYPTGLQLHGDATPAIQAAALGGGGSGGSAGDSGDNGEDQPHQGIQPPGGFDLL